MTHPKKRPADLAAWLTERGWHTWYHPNYWVHRKMVRDEKRQDYTNYGMPIDVAYRAETEEWPPFEPMGIPALGIMAHPKRGPKTAARAKRKERGT